MTRLRTALFATALVAVAVPAFASPVAPAVRSADAPSSLIQVHDDRGRRHFDHRDHRRYEYEQQRRIEAQRHHERRMLAEQRARYEYERRVAAEQYRYGYGHDRYAYNNGGDLNVLLRLFAN